MRFVRHPGVTGKIYLPEDCDVDTQKHRCADCYACQQCGDDRCRVCREGTNQRLPAGGCCLREIGNPRPAVPPQTLRKD